jgi:hypothetical protein
LDRDVLRYPQRYPHGRRVILNVARDAIERQLAHGERNNVRAGYNFAEYLPKRRRMMQAWADCLDALRASADVIPIRRSG